jgi:predicted RND superfamily exporter protein
MIDRLAHILTGKSVSHWIVAVTTLAIPVLVYFAIQAKSNTQDVQTWLPQRTQQRTDYDRFVSLFGNDDDIMVSWPGCTIADPRLAAFADQLNSHTATTNPDSPQSRSALFLQIVTGQDVVQRMTDCDPRLSEEQAQKRMSGLFFGPDCNTTGMLIRLSDVGREDRKACVAQIVTSAAQVPGLRPQDLRLGGSSYVNVEIDNATNKALLYGVPAIGLVLLITLFSMGSLRLTLISLSLAGLAALTSVAFMCACGFKINGLMVLTPVLVLVLTLSGAVHMTSYYREAWQRIAILEIGNDRQAIIQMLKKSWRPCTLAIITTCLGILTLTTSHVEAVSQFGLLSAVSLLFALVMLLVLHPALLTIWPPSAARGDSTGPRKFAPQLDRFRPAAAGHAWMASLVVLAVLGATPILLQGLQKIETTLSIEDMFDASSDVNRNYNWLNDNFAPLECVEVVCAFKKPAMVESDARSVKNPLTRQVQCVEFIQQKLANLDKIRSDFSFADICGKPNRSKGFRGNVKRVVYENRLNEEIPSIIDQQLLAEDNEHLYWRIHLGVSAQDNEQDDAFVLQIEETAKRAANAVVSRPEVFVTGIWPLTAAGRNQLFTDLATSFVMAFIMITPLMMLVLRGVMMGLIAMIPNVVPALLFFGIMGWMDFPVDIGTILTASVGMGIAVDDTLHFLEYYMRQRNGRSRASAVRATVRHCRRPILQTTLICAAGLSVFAFSDFIPARQFAIAIVVLLFLALACDLVLLPALILSPLGRFFDRGNTKFRTVIVETVPGTRFARQI